MRIELRSAASGALGMALAGSSVPLAGLLEHYPFLAGQAMRYAIAGVVLLGWLGLRGARFPLPSRRDVLALMLLAATGMLGFSASVLYAQRFAQPGFVSAFAGASPLALALLGPVLARQRHRPLVLAGAALVALGVVVLSGGGSWRWPGLLLAVLAMVMEACFTLLAVGVVGRLGALPVSAYGCLVAAAEAALVSPFTGGWRWPEPTEWTAIVVYGVLLTSVAFACWYRCVVALGADRAGVLIGVIPLAGLGVAVLLGRQSLTLAATVGAVTVAAGCALGLSGGRRQRVERRRRLASASAGGV